jgi:deoxyribonuclease-4
MGLEPRVFHMSDGMLSGERDEHLGIGEGEYDFGFLMKCVEERTSALVTFETPRMRKSLDEDIKNLYILMDTIKLS